VTVFINYFIYIYIYICSFLINADPIANRLSHMVRVEYVILLSIYTYWAVNEMVLFVRHQFSIPALF
jgi:Na+-translocating ferredoxin:NAD+ oxidoreductase RnfA subunit